MTHPTKSPRVKASFWVYDDIIASDHEEEHAESVAFRFITLTEDDPRYTIQTGGETDEGSYFSETIYELNSEGVTVYSEWWGRDCDGRNGGEYRAFCPLDKLASHRNPHHPPGIMVPEWEEYR